MASTIAIKFDSTLDVDQRRERMSEVMKGLGMIHLKAMRLFKDGYPELDYDGSDETLGLADELKLTYEKI